MASLDRPGRITSEVTQDQLKREFPDWYTFRGVGGLWLARSGPPDHPTVVRGEDLTDLRDSIRRVAGPES